MSSVESDNFFGESRLPLKQDKQSKNHITKEKDLEQNISKNDKHTKGSIKKKKKCEKFHTPSRILEYFPKLKLQWI